MKNIKAIGMFILSTIAKLFIGMIRIYCDIQLAFDRKVLKRYLGIETPFYRIWHESHSKRIQRRLDLAHLDWA